MNCWIKGIIEFTSEDVLEQNFSEQWWNGKKAQRNILGVGIITSSIWLEGGMGIAIGGEAESLRVDW